MKKAFAAAVTALLSLNCAHIRPQEYNKNYCVIEQRLPSHFVIDEDLGMPFFDMPALDLYVSISQGIVTVYDYNGKKHADIPEDITQRLQQIPHKTIDSLLLDVSQIGESVHISRASLYPKLNKKVSEPYTRPKTQ